MINYNKRIVESKLKTLEKKKSINNKIDWKNIIILIIIIIILFFLI